MSRNFYTHKTGHAASDAYFKKQAIWMDSDLLNAFLIGSGSGALVALIVILSLKKTLDKTCLVC